MDDANHAGADQGDRSAVSHHNGESGTGYSRDRGVGQRSCVLAWAVDPNDATPVHLVEPRARMGGKVRPAILRSLRGRAHCEIRVGGVGKSDFDATLAQRVPT